MTEVNAMPIDVFVRQGYLSELNRRILNPLGLHLMAQAGDSGEYRSLGPVVDLRDDPEGFVTEDPGQVEAMRAAAVRVAELESERRPDREARLGFWVQPALEDDDLAEDEEPQGIDTGEILRHLATILRKTTAPELARATAGASLLDFITAAGGAPRPAEEPAKKPSIFVPHPGTVV